jgi:DNA-binding MarR family transcriptional regulator
MMADHSTHNTSDSTSTSEGYELLMLENQLCFSLYVCSKEIIKKYKPLLDPYGLTYTGYIILMALWEQDDITVKDLGKRLYLDSGTLTPMLKKLEALDYVKRIRSSSDERNVYIQLTTKGHDFRKEALAIPKSMICALNLEPSLAGDLLSALHKMMQQFDAGATD